MELGVFHECHRPRSYSETDAFDEIFTHAEEAERYGFDAIWLAEIHFSPTRSVLAAPLVIAAALAARTKRLKIGTAVHVLPLSNPLRTAEEAATLTYEEAQRDKLAYGTPEMVIDRLQELRESLRFSGILAEMNCGHQVPNPHIVSSMRLFMEKVAPALR